MTTVTVVPTVEAGNVPPRVRLDVTDVGSSPAITLTTVTRLDPDGRTRTVRTTDGGPLGLSPSGGNRIGLLYDYEMPLGEPVTYSTLETPANVSAPVTVDSSSVWLIHPGVPELSMPVDFYADSFIEETWDVEQGVFWPLGRDTPVVQSSGVRRAAAGSFTLAVDTADDLAGIKALLADAMPLLLNAPPTLGLQIDTAYMSLSGAKVRRLADIGTDPHRSVRLDYQVVDRPAGGTAAERTYADVLAGSATYADLLVKYPTYFDLLAGP